MIIGISRIFLILTLLISMQVKADSCPVTSLIVEPGQQLFKGEGRTEKEAINNAVVKASILLNGAAVRNQNIIKHKQGKSTFESFKMLSQTAQLTGIIAHQTFFCVRGSVAYLVVETRNLEELVAAFFNDDKKHLVGPAFLVESQLLRNYHSVKAKDKVTVSLIENSSGQYKLVIGSKSFAIKSEYINSMLIHWANNHAALNHSVRKTYESGQEVWLIKNTSSTTVSVFYCNPSLNCDLVSKRLETLMELPIYLNNDDPLSDHNGFIITVANNIIEMNSNSYLIYNSQSLKLIELVENYPQQSTIFTLH